MSRPIEIVLTDEERRSLAKVTHSPTAAVCDVQRAKVVLLAAEGLHNVEIAQRLNCQTNTARKWRNRFRDRRLDGLKDKPGRGRKPIYGPDKEAEIIAATLIQPENATHWSARRLAKKVRVSKSTVHRIWKAHNLQPHREKTFKYSHDPKLVEKVVDVIGLYLDPPDGALVLSIDEKTQIQALERTQPILPLGPGHPASRTHDYQRNGTTTLYAALNLTNPAVIGRCSKRHRHQEFLAFMRIIDQEYPEGEIHLVLDNYGTHKHAKVERWFKRRPRYHRHFTPTSASWMNMVEGWFSILTRQRIRRGSFTSEIVLQKMIHRYIREWNKNPVAFRWVKTAEEVLRNYNVSI